ncbi:MAG: asparagine synthase (glutamine-hydrolyzing), partial [Bacteroidota bacterium]
MCGIAGIWCKEEISASRRAALREASNSIALRGPDAKGTNISPNCWLEHRRLSIIDTSSDSNQPMVRDSYSLTFNGEIYNYRELREELIGKGKIFKTQGDTEVLLLGLMDQGVDFLKKINGFFAFAFYDSVTNELILGRDRFGIKPLYYSVHAEEVIFGSGLGTITPFLSDKKIDHDSLSLYLSLSYVPFPRTILEGVSKLKPGTALIISENRREEITYYNLNQLPKAKDSYETAQKRVKELLVNSVKKRMVADVPVGTFLSGGVDSSIITLLASKLNPKIPTFSIGFPNQPYFDESEKAGKIAKYLG